jgi:hypothetical protein
MTRTRIVLTLALVAAVAMLLGLLASTFVVRITPQTPDSRPEATEPQRPAGTVANG